MSAAVEVAVVFAAMHVALRAFMKFTALGRAEYEAGLNFSPGAAMMIATALMRREALRCAEPSRRG